MKWTVKADSEEAVRKGQEDDWSRLLSDWDFIEDMQVTDVWEDYNA